MAIEERVGAGEIDVLEDTPCGRARLHDLLAMQAVGVDRDELTGPHIADELRADVVQRAGL